MQRDADRYTRAVHNKITLACLAALLLPWLIVESATAESPAAAARAGSLSVTEAWSRPTPPGATLGVLYFSIANAGKHSDRLLALNTPIAKKIELHESQAVNGTIEMHPVSFLECPPGTIVAASPGGLHAMLLGLTQPLTAGAMFSVTLQFRDAGAVTVPVAVRTNESTVAR
jgi:periplasmic copper chaperone A